MKNWPFTSIGCMKLIPGYLLLFCVLVAGITVFARPEKPYKMAEEVALPTPGGDTLRLSSLRGKVVLVDFWASWCGPCRVSNQHLTELYEKYHAQGFEIFGVSIDNDRERWKAAITTDKINWLQVNQQGGWQAPITYQWHIDKLPSSFLIDQEGRIVAVDPSYGVIKSWLKDLL